MSVSKKDLEAIAHLARLNIDENEKEKFVLQVNQILDYVKKLDELDTESVKPLSHSLDLQNVSREDVEGKSLSQDEALKNSPHKKEPFFRVPKVIAR